MKAMTKKTLITRSEIDLGIGGVETNMSEKVLGCIRVKRQIGSDFVWEVLVFTPDRVFVARVAKVPYRTFVGNDFADGISHWSLVGGDAAARAHGRLFALHCSKL